MNINVSDIQQARLKRDSFLNMNYKPLEIIADSNDNLYYIYMIAHKSNFKLKYIGKTKNIYDRALNYIRNVETYSKDTTKWARPITKALYSEGINSFIMYPIATVNGKENAGIIEQMLIRKHHTHISEEGLNVSLTVDMSGNNTRTGCPHSVDTKIKKSKPMIAINNESKTILIAIGGKILGDLLNASKDLIKNVIRKPCHLRDWYIYYLNEYDREDILQKYLNKQTKNVPGIKLYRSESDDYVIGSKFVGRFVDNPSKDVIAESEYSDYNVIFVTYNPDYDNSPLTASYKLCSLDDFLNLIN